MSLTRSTAPTVEPISLQDAKLFLRVDLSNDDVSIRNMIQTAREQCEEYTQRSFISQTWDLWLDKFPYGNSDKWWDGVVEAASNYITDGRRFIILPRPPLISVSYMKTYDVDDTVSTFSSDNYNIEASTFQGRLSLKTGIIWPVPIRAVNGINIRFTAGYGTDATNVPAGIKQAILMTITNLYERRGDVEDLIPSAAKKLLDPYKVMYLDDPNTRCY